MSKIKFFLMAVFLIIPLTSLASGYAILGQYNLPANYDVRSLHLDGNLLYVGLLDMNGSTGELRIVDVSSPANPQLLGALADSSMLVDIQVQGDYAYLALAGAPHTSGSMRIVDVSNPTNPIAMGSYATYSGRGLDVAGDYVFLGDDVPGIKLFDVSNKNAPSLCHEEPNSIYARGVVKDGDYLYLADSPGGLKIFDVSVPCTTSYVGGNPAPSCKGPGCDWAIDVAVEWPYAILGREEGGLQVFDVTNPSNPLHISTIGDTIANNFRWVQLINQTAFVGDEANGLRVYDLTDPYNPVETDCLPPSGAVVVTDGVLVAWGGGGTTVTLAKYGHPTILSVVDVGNDQGRQVRLSWMRSAYDAPGDSVLVTGYSIFRRQDPGLSSPFAMGDLPRYRGPVGAPQLAGWDYIASVPARGDDEYQLVVPTLCDSTDSGICWSTFMVSAVTSDQFVYFDSAPDSGYSIDNIAPGVPPAFFVVYNTGRGNELTWDPVPDEDLKYYKIYRGTHPGFTPAPGNLVDMTTSMIWNDLEYDGWQVFYKVTAVDDAGNEGDPAGPEPATGTDDKPAIPDRFALYQNVPNPFNPTTVIRYDVPSGGGYVTLKVFDVAGRLVRTLVDGPQAAGVNRIEWDGTNESGDNVSTGVYFCRLTAPNYTQTMRMTLLK